MLSSWRNGPFDVHCLVDVLRTDHLITARALPSGNTSEVDIFEFSIFDRTPCWHLLLPLLLVGSATSGSTSVPLSYYFTPPPKPGISGCQHRRRMLSRNGAQS